jgi:hypothetical protein
MPPTSKSDERLSSSDPTEWRGSLCPRCGACRRIDGRQSTFLMCTALPQKYPRQPVLVCGSFREANMPPAEK